MSLREEVSKALNVLIPRNGWRQKFAELDAGGKLDIRTMQQLLLILLEHVERLEDERPPTKRPEPHLH